MWTDLRFRLRALFHRGAVESELSDELREHQERLVEKLVRQGMTGAEARRRARLEFGGVGQLADDCRDAWGTRWLADLGKDVQYALRTLRRSPVFATVAMLSLALGIGANTAIFSVVHAVLLRPLPYSDPSRVVMLWDTQPARGRMHNVLSPADFVEWRRRSTAFENMAAIDLALSNLTGFADPEEMRGQFVTPEFFPLLGVHTAIGRVFTAQEAAVSARVVVISDRLWRQRFGADPGVLGLTLELDRKPLTIIGVMPRDFEFFDSDAQFWRPYRLQLTDDPRKDSGRFLYAVARLKGSVTQRQAQQQMDAIAAQLAAEFPETHKGWGARVVELSEEVSGEYRRPLYVLLAAVSLVLLIACINVANLLLARARSRRREMAVRASIGAGPGRLARQLFTESLVLAALGCAGGLLLGDWSLHALKAWTQDLSRAGMTGIDGGVLAYTMLLSIAAALTFGIAPALSGARAAPYSRVKDGARAAGSRSWRRLPGALVTIELALSLVLLAGAALLTRSFANLLSVETGFRADHVMTARVLLPSSYEQGQTLAFFQEAVHRLEGLPGVRAASAVSFKPFGGIRPGTEFQVANRPAPAAGEAPITEVRAILPRYFLTMGIPLIRGRDFRTGEGDPQHPVFIVNQSLAAKYFPGEDAIGRRITVSMGKSAPGEIIGIAADTKDETLDGRTVAPCVFFPHAALPISYMSFVMRTGGDPIHSAGAISQVVHSLDAHQPVVDIRSMDDVLRRSVSRRHIQTLLMVFFAAAALLLAAIGIYGVISFAVAQRTNEIGIRMALGATRGDVLRLILRQGGLIVAGGLLLGMAGAFAFARTLSTLLFEVKATDPLAFGAGAALLVLVALAAIAGPARRATRVDPGIALRWE